MTDLRGQDDRVDPYRRFRYVVKWDGVHVAGASKVAGLDDPPPSGRRHPPGVPPTRRPAGESVPVTLLDGLTCDQQFARWASNTFEWTVPARASGIAVPQSSRGTRKDMVIELYDAAGRLVGAWQLFSCWPSEFDAAPDLDAHDSGLAIARLVLQNERRERLPIPAANGQGGGKS